jgi:hypothetical protein
MSTNTVKTCSFKQKIYTKTKSLGGKTVLLFSLWSCTATSLPAPDVTWNTYNNSRYGFEFPYPSNWNPLPAKVNNDGIVLVSPKNNYVEIRAWAANRLPDSKENTKTTINPNSRSSPILLAGAQPEARIVRLLSFVLLHRLPVPDSGVGEVREWGSIVKNSDS